MKVSLSWLKELVKVGVSNEKLAELLNSRIQGGVREVTDNYIELDLKGYNRPDLLSLRGVAYEVAALTNSEILLNEPEESKYPWSSEKLPETSVKVEAFDLCPVYCIAKIEGLKVDKSPAGWVKKLNDSGMRSVNNVADVTNLIMLEYGQPLHSFDSGQVKDQALVVRTANTGEELLTLDNKKRILEPVDIVIADSEKAVGIAGVMGGKESEITEDTSTILLEAAIFDPTSIRRTATRLSLPSEASKRFQHGLTKKRLLQALEAAIRMYKELGGTLTAVTIVDSLEEQPKEIVLSEEKLNSLIGVELDKHFAESALKRLNFQVQEHLEGGKYWVVKPPYFRLDIEIEEDVIEEVARIYGYENIPAKELKGKFQGKVDQGLFEFIYNLKQALAEGGLDEIQTYSFYSTKVLEALGINGEELIKVANPMSKETEYLRNTLISSILEKVGENLKNMSEVGIFEVGKVYQIKDNEPVEKYHLSMALADNSNNPLATLYSIFTSSCSHLECGNITLKSRPLAEYEQQLSHPNRFARLFHKGQEIGFMAEVHPRLTNKFGIDKRVAVFEIDLTTLI